MAQGMTPRGCSQAQSVPIAVGTQKDRPHSVMATLQAEGSSAGAYEDAIL